MAQPEDGGDQDAGDADRRQRVLHRGRAAIFVIAARNSGMAFQHARSPPCHIVGGPRPFCLSD